MSNSFERDIQQLETSKPEFIFTPNKRLRKTDIEMNINSFQFDENQETPVVLQPFVLSLPEEKTGFIYNKQHNPFLKKPVASLHLCTNKSPTSSAFIGDKNNGYHAIQNCKGENNIHAVVLDENSVAKKDLRFSKIILAKINGVIVSVNNYSQLRNKLLGMFYRKAFRPDNGISYWKDGLSVHGVGSKQSILAIIRLAKMLDFRLNIKLSLRTGQIVNLVV